MIQILEQTENNVIATKATKKLTTTDYEKLLPILKDRLKQYEKIRWYFEMENFQGWELKAFWEDVKFDAKHANDFEKIAMVGDKQWEKWMTDLMKPFTPAEIKFFELAEREKALTWIKQ
jgi:predicted transposase YbfD/YdcC